MLALHDQDLRGALTQMIAELGHAPHVHDLAARVGAHIDDVDAGLQRLHDAHALLLHLHSRRPWVVHPFALSAGACWVQTPRLGYWANCLYCAFGIAAALGTDAVIATRIAGEREPVEYIVRGGRPEASADLFHLSTPVAHWWDNVIHACASFQPFHAEADIDDWCARHALPRGAVLSIPALWDFASDWYGSYLQTPWRKRSLDEVRALFGRHGLTSEFWRI
jgi:Alkylmercury lyase